MNRDAAALFIVIVLFILSEAAQAAALVGQWDFNNTANLTAATVGSNLVLSGSHTAVSGVRTGDGAARIGSNSYYKVTNGIGANGGGNLTNEWTLVYDIRCPLTAAYSSLLQTNKTNTNDGELFTKSTGEIGVAATQYASAGTVVANTWYRLVVRVDNGSFYELWIDGVRVLNGTAQAIDGRFSLENVFLLFADEDGEEEAVDVSRIVFYNGALSESEIQSLGGVLPPPVLAGQWDFNDPANLTAATTGTDMILNGSHTAVAGFNGYDGAARIGMGSFYSCSHGIASNGGGSKVNSWSAVIDLSYPSSSMGYWKCLFQTDPLNSDDGECFIHPDGSIGLAATGYSGSDMGTPAFYTLPDTWYRVVIVVNNGSEYSIYANGTKVLAGAVQSIDGRFSLEDTLFWFADESGEDYPIDVSMVALYDRALSPSQAAALKGPGGQDLPQATLILTRPYLQNVKTNGITVMWEVNKQVSCTLAYGLDSNYGVSAAITSENSGGGSVIYKAVLTGLVPDQMYHYQVTIDGIPLDDRTFETAPSSRVNFSFAVWSDSQGTNHGTYPADPYEPTKSMMAHMAASGVKFAVTSGDLAENGDSYSDTKYYYLDRVAENLGQTVPWFNAWGNHDAGQFSVIRKFADMPSKDQGAPYTAGYGSFSFDYAGCHFICIDDLTRSNFAWIQNDLQQAAANNARQIFLFIHRPPYSERWYSGETELRTNLVPLMEQYGVDICFSGHTHEYERGWMNNVYYCMTGGGSWLDFAEPLIYDWPHITVGGYHSLGSGISGGLVNEYVRVDVTEHGWTATMVPFYYDGTPRTDVADAFGSPTFSSDSITAENATEDAFYSSSIASEGIDPEGMPLTFSKVAGPSWLQVSADGILTGTPLNTNAGLNHFVIRCENTHNNYDQATLNIRVNNLYDGEEGLADFVEFARHWGDSECLDAPSCGGADLNGDKDVDMDDLNIFALRWLDAIP
ncbi:MAG TPA: metallophosphoesterase [Anaerohalosphaeraceae bacterium]|nr:metallophosphoesterase [Anaerohalosphaeraceae bacterium]